VFLARNFLLNYSDNFAEESTVSFSPAPAVWNSLSPVT